MTALDLLVSMRDHVGTWGTHATTEQYADGEAILATPTGPRRHWLGRAKGYSKSRDVAGMSLAVLLADMPSGAMAYCGASDADQAALIRQSIRSFVDHTPALAGVQVDQRRVVAPSGAELVILAADAAGSHGLRPYWLVVDELANWPDTERHRTFFDSLWAGLPKVPGSRGIIMTTAGAPSHFSRRIIDNARSDPAWRVSDLHGPPPWVDPAEVEAERRRLFPSVFRRLWLNEWAEGEDSIADPDDVAAACHLAGPLAPVEGVRYIGTLDLGVRNDRTVAVIAHATPSPEGTRVTVDAMRTWVPRPGAPVSLDDVRLWLVEFCRSYRATLHYDPSQAYLLVEQLRKAGVACVEWTFSSSSVGRLATALMQSLRGRLLDLPDDPDLRDELLAVRLRETSPNVLRLDHKSGGHDDRAITVGMAVEVLTGLLGGSVLFDVPEQVPVAALDGSDLLLPLAGRYAIAAEHTFAAVLDASDDAFLLP